MVRRAERCAPAVFDATTAASSGTEATAAVSAATRGAETLSRPPSGVAPTARLQGAIATASTAEQTSTPAAARVLREVRTRATPKTVAAMRKGITAATL